MDRERLAAPIVLTNPFRDLSNNPFKVGSITNAIRNRKRLASGRYPQSMPWTMFPDFGTAHTFKPLNDHTLWQGMVAPRLVSHSPGFAPDLP